jgi:hypothetical protein
MTDANHVLVQRIIESNPTQSKGSTRELFATFVRETAPVIEFLEGQGVACTFFSSHSFGVGWSVGFMPDTENCLVQFVARKWYDAPPDRLEVKQQGIVQSEASTPAGLLNYARKKFGAPTP